jgi:sulfate adenylyltransferase
MIAPHGGKLINRFTKKEKLDLDNIDLEVFLDVDQVNELRNIANGLYSPLTGYMNKEDFDSVLESMKFANGIIWTIPTIFPISKTEWNKLKPGSQVMLKQKRGEKEVDLGIIIVEDKYKFDKKKYNKSVYGTNDKNHPGVSMIAELDDYLIGGDIWAFDHFEVDLPDYDLAPAKTREIIEKNGWQTAVGFQTRNPAHRAHEYVQKQALEFVDGLFVNPIIGKKKKGDFKDEVILSVYTELVRQFYPRNSSLITIYNSKMHYAGPKEAVMHAIVRKNFGCSHFLVGRDHAGVGDYYDKYAAHKIFDELDDIDVQIMKVSAAFYCRRCDLYTTEKICPHNEIYRVSPSGTQIREYIKQKNYEALRRVMRDEVLDIIFSFDNPFVG